MELFPHSPAERLIHFLVLTDPRQAAEALGDDSGRIMVAVAGKVGDLHAGVGNPAADQRLDLVRRPPHRLSPPPASAGGGPRPSCARAPRGCAPRRTRP